jgi:hypothetical protein
VPFTSFCEYADTKPKKTPTWFAFDETRPLEVFAGIWTTWRGKRGTKSKPIEGEHQLFGFLTTDANAEVGAIHPKAMPVILPSTEEIGHWMSAPADDALKLQRPCVTTRCGSWRRARKKMGRAKWKPLPGESGCFDLGAVYKGLARDSGFDSRMPLGEAGLSRGDLNEAEWRLLEPLLPPERGHKSRPAFDNRQIVNGIL